MKHNILLVMTALLAVGCAGGPPRKAGEEGIAYLDYAGEPVRGFTSFRLQSWQPLPATDWSSGPVSTRPTC